MTHPTGDLLASIYRVVGVDHQATVRDRQNRPIPILELGEPIAELFSTPLVCLIVSLRR